MTVTFEEFVAKYNAAIIESRQHKIDNYPDLDGPLVPLPTKPEHRYTKLGFTPNKFGEH